MKTLFIGDIHGRYEIVEKALDSEHRCIFLGDFLDSYDRPVKDQIRSLALVINAIKKEPKRIFSLAGNHELSYFMPFMRCSGYNPETADSLQQFTAEELGLLKDYIWASEYLVSHAGVSKRLLTYTKQTLDDYLKNGDLYCIGIARGGMQPAGGLFWCDWFQEFEPIQTPQIVGHTGYRLSGMQGVGIMQKENSYCVDCYAHKEEFLLLNEDGKIEITNEF